MIVLTYDKGALDIIYLCKGPSSVDIYIQHDVSEPEFYEDPLEE